ncbi:MAG TPA: AraC family transcriptional regulator ligand-binding domain-containing protein [Aquabacterium sp.]|uniref:AraC family transcriptional regulator n=1 Tax=Aquabacterium sp. TaxID=1872578 RepID=UPI002E312756|nr:AraC family transcriptional regulator ligand-binding domain-containing protein [Aquabacterium sp.]HEX5374257.1 AraC family transcriptional regulator ligand-binding domain-containing protein [Aquabacterium sp.]
MNAHLLRVSTMSVYPLLQCAQDEGLPLEPLLAGTTQTEATLRDPNRDMPFSQELIVVRNYLRLTRESVPGLRASAFYHYNSFGTLGAALVSHPDMLEACRFLARYVELTFTPFRVLMEEAGEQVNARYIDCIDLGDCREFYLMRDLAFIRNLSKEAGADDWATLVDAMEIAMPAPADLGTVEAFFGWPLHFDAADTRIIARKAALLRPLRLANPITLRIMQEQCDTQLLKRQHNPWSRQVENLLLSSHPMPDLRTVAERLHCAERTLRRRLQAESCTFQDLVSQIQQQRAIHHLRHTHLPIEVIAERLGYSETAAFAHAFKRWTGQTPSTFRQHSRQAQTDGAPAS